MSFTDEKYINLSSSFLDKFSHKKAGVYNFRCPYCGDSKKHRNKARGYLIRKKGTTSTGFGSLWLAPRLPKLYEKYPELKIDLMLEERVLDLPMREADVAIRMKEPSQADLIRKRLMSVKMRLYASPTYIKTHGVPEKIEDMVNHRLICQHPRSAQVSAGLALTQHLMTYDLPSMLTVNNYFGVLQAVIHDLGIGILPDYITLDFDGVVRVLDELESVEVPVYLAYPEELRHSKRIEAFRNFVQDEIIDYRRALRNGELSQ